jgi:hypothetical protein
MVRMTCDRCGVEKPVEDFELGRLRPDFRSHEIQAIDRLRREPELVCRACYRPPVGMQLLDLSLANDVGERPILQQSILDLVADLVDRLRRWGR